MALRATMTLRVHNETNLTSGLQCGLSDLDELGSDFSSSPVLNGGDEHFELNPLREGVGVLLEGLEEGALGRFMRFGGKSGNVMGSTQRWFALKVRTEAASSMRIRSGGPGVP